MLSLLLAFLCFLPISTVAQSITFKQALARELSDDNTILAFYKERRFKSLWMGSSANERERLSALIMAFSQAEMHGLPAKLFSGTDLQRKIKQARTERKRGAIEAQLTLKFLKYVSVVRSGILVPSEVDKEIVRKVPRPNFKAILSKLTQRNPRAYFRALLPKSSEYTQLVKEKMRLENALSQGGWGPTVPLSALKVGATGGAVVTLRKRLTKMGFLRATTSVNYDAKLVGGLKRFQRAHGLKADGEAGLTTLSQINVTMEQRLGSVLVAMERERWNNRPLGERHILVNLADFTAKIMDHGITTFVSKSVVGANDSFRRSPEFSDMMSFMIINPSWYVPRSIIIKEYLPLLKDDPESVSHLEFRDDFGNVVNRSDIDFQSYTGKDFPFGMREPPSQTNALGLVKFMFPNIHNIYLHDTPAKNLFGKEVRAFSHGCIRLGRPLEFAYALLARQENDPKRIFSDALSSGTEIRIDLETPVPVHLIYRTAITKPGGGLEFRRDVYGRDAKIWEALKRKGVVLRSITG
jgi:L,D-transpeptidase YcbB